MPEKANSFSGISDGVTTDLLIEDAETLYL